MNKLEQRFCTKLSSYLRSTRPEISMLIEVKVCDQRFLFSELRKSQLATLRKLHEGIPVVHKIADGGVGSKLVDLIYIHPDCVNVHGMVAIQFQAEKQSVLLPFYVIDIFMKQGQKSIKLSDVREEYIIKWK